MVKALVQPNGRITFLFLALALGCSSSSRERPTSGSLPVGTSGQDRTAIQTRIRRDDDAVAEAYRLEHVDDLPSTAQEVIDRYLEAIGGREAFDTIQTMIKRSTHHGPGGKMASQVRYFKKPLYYRWEQSDASVALVTDGSRFWWVGADGWEEIADGTSYLPAASMDGHFVDPEAMGIVYELVGVAAFDGNPGFEVRRIWPHGREELLFFSAESGLLTLMRYPHPLGGDYWFSYWDYRNMGGWSLPFVQITNLEILFVPHGSVVQEIEVNVSLPDSLFLPRGEGGGSVRMPMTP